jgi:hypothetical protein
LPLRDCLQHELPQAAHGGAQTNPESHHVFLAWLPQYARVFTGKDHVQHIWSGSIEVAREIISTDTVPDHTTPAKGGEFLLE